MMGMVSGAAAPGEGTAVAGPLIAAQGLTKRYDGFELQGVNLVVEPGQVVGFIGKNGAGKSTTIKALLGLIVRDAGGATVFGVDANELSRTAAARVKEQVGVVFDTIGLPDHMRIARVGALMARAFSTWDASAFRGYLRAFGLDEKKRVKELSRGMGMKLSLACALAHHPRLLILDEATAGLDPMAREEVLDILRAFVDTEDADGNPQNGILMSSHITSDLDKIADTIVCIDEGRIVFEVAKDEVVDTMGIARCRAADMQQALAWTAAAGEYPRVLRHEYGIDVLVGDRFAFRQALPSIPCDRMGIDDYMALMLKGERVSGGDAR